MPLPTLPLTLLLASAALSPYHPKPLICTIIQAPFDYTLTDLHGPRPAFDLALCQAVAAALQTKAIPLAVPDESSAIAALRSGRADLIPTLSLNLKNSVDSTLTLTPPILLDATGLLVPVDISSISDLANRKICFFAETEVETSLHTWFRLHKLDFLPYPFSEEGEMQAAFASGTCPAIAGDLTRLAAVRASLSHPALYKLLPEILTPAPLASATRRSDLTLSRAVLSAEQLLLNAENLGVTQANLPQQRTSSDPAIQRLLGKTHELGPAAGLDDAFPIRVLQSTGNFGELVRRTLPLTLPDPPAIPLN